MESFQKRERDRRKLLKRREKADRRKERSRSHADPAEGVLPVLPVVEVVTQEDSSALRVAAPGPGGAGGTP